ncbi:hypothetical protein H4582DRAFT_2018344 [Lactarius indigo]|nr:hypothetical protein H4582DRAFT_2018344 [Lactarius indigo]
MRRETFTQVDREVAYGSVLFVIFNAHRHDILSEGKRGLSAPYGYRWKRWRKLQHIGMNGSAAIYYREQ